MRFSSLSFFFFLPFCSSFLHPVSYEYCSISKCYVWKQLLYDVCCPHSGSSLTAAVTTVITSTPKGLLSSLFSIALMTCHFALALCSILIWYNATNLGSMYYLSRVCASIYIRKSKQLTKHPIKSNAWEKHILYTRHCLEVLCYSIRHGLAVDKSLACRRLISHNLPDTVFNVKQVKTTEEWMEESVESVHGAFFLVWSWLRYIYIQS